MMTAAANDIAPAAPRAAVTITVWEIRTADRKIRGRVHPGTVVTGHSAQITPGASIRLFGTNGSGTYETPFCREFSIGDAAVYGGFNLTYTGVIRSITEKTVTVVEREGSHGERVHRMSLADFDSWNWDYDVEETARRNATWSD